VRYRQRAEIEGGEYNEINRMGEGKKNDGLS
jgi:hypothetical protein